MERITALWARFKYFKMEYAFRQEHLRFDKLQTIVGILILLLPIILFCSSDYYLFQTSRQFFSLLIVRGLLFLLTLVVLHLVPRVKVFNRLDGLILIWWFAFVAANFYINSTRPAEYIGHSMIDILILLSIYILLPNRLILQIIPALLFTLGNVLLILFNKLPLTVMQSNVLWITYLVGNGLGIFIAWRLHIVRRMQFETSYNESRLAKKLHKLNVNKDKLFSIISHDLRSPFNPLLGMTKILSDTSNTLTREEVNISAQKIHESASKVFVLIDNLLQWARIQSDKLKPNQSEFDLNELIKSNIDILSNYIESKNIQITNDVKSEFFVFADKDMIRSVLQNLLSNALKFNNEGGYIKIAAAHKYDMAEITISDDGIGMGKDDLRKLFGNSSFHTTYGTAGEKGTGLGLVICKELVEQNKGTITVESELGKGSTFKFTLPLKRE